MRAKRKSLPRNEQETIIQRCNDDPEWHVYTCDETMKRRLSKILCRLKRNWTEVDEYGVEAQLPISCVRILMRTSLSPEQKAKRSEHAKLVFHRTRNREIAAP